MCLYVYVITHYLCYMYSQLLTSLLPEEGGSEEILSTQMGSDASTRQDVHPVASDGIVVVMGNVYNPIFAT